MHQNLHRKLRELRERRNTDDGFTLIELLVVVVIIGVLVAIAIPVYLSYSEGAQNKSAQADVRGAIGSIENFYIKNSNTLPANDSSPLPAAGGPSITLKLGATPTTDKITVSEGNTLQYKQGTAANAGAYIICAQNTDGKKVFFYNSKVGGSVAEYKTGTPPTIAGCIGQLT